MLSTAAKSNQVAIPQICSDKIDAKHHQLNKRNSNLCDKSFFQSSQHNCFKFYAESRLEVIALI